MNSFIDVFNMHGYGFYVYSAYSIVISTLSVHLFGAVRRAKYIRTVISKR